MKKLVIIAVVLTVNFVAVGCGTKQSAEQENEKSKTQMNSESADNGNSPSDKLGEVLRKGALVGEQIQTALKNGETLECTYRVADAGEQSNIKTYIAGEKYKSIVTAEEGEFNAIFDGETQYSWNSLGDKKGVKMSSKCMEELGDGVKPEEDLNDVSGYEDVKTADEILDQNVEMSCDKTGNVDFRVPGDIEFVDQCEMLKVQMKQMQQLQQSLPDDVMKQMQQEQ